MMDLPQRAGAGSGSKTRTAASGKGDWGRLRCRSLVPTLLLYGRRWPNDGLLLRRKSIHRAGACDEVNRTLISAIGYPNNAIYTKKSDWRSINLTSSAGQAGRGGPAVQPAVGEGRTHRPAVSSCRASPLASSLPPVVACDVPPPPAPARSHSPGT